MIEYPKINTMFKREQFKQNRLLIGQWSSPEFEYLQNNQWVFTEKVDGMNIRVMVQGSEIAFAGRTDAAQLPPHLLLALEALFSGHGGRSEVRELFSQDSKTKVCLYGEGYGHKIQSGGKYRQDSVGFCLFDVMVDGLWLERSNVVDIAMGLAIGFAPEIGRGTLSEGMNMVAAGHKSTWGDFLAEGIVCRPKVEMLDRRGRRIITKIKHKDFQS